MAKNISDKAPLTPRFRFFAISFVVLSLLLVAFIIFFASTKAVITVYPKKSLASVDFPLRVVNSASADELSTGAVRGIVAQKEMTQEFQVESTGKKSVTASAGAIMITVINTSKTAQPLVATTRFLTPDNVLYRLKRGVTVPVEGSIQAEVSPDKKGVESVGPAKLTIPGLNEAKQKLIYGELAEQKTDSVEGNMIRVLSEDDVANGKAGALEKMENDAKVSMQKEHPELKDVAIDRTVISVITSANAGDAVQNATITVKAKITVVAYDKDAVVRLAREKLALTIPDDRELVAFHDQAFLVRLTDSDPAKGSATIKVYADGDSIIKETNKLLNKVSIAGMTPTQAKEYFESFDTIEKAEVMLFPSMLKKIPTVKDHIEVIIKK